LERLNCYKISTVPCTRDVYPCADVNERPIRIYIDQRSKRQPVVHCRCGDSKSTNTTIASLTSKLAAFNVLPAQLRLSQRLDCQLSIRLSTRLPLNSLFKVLFNCPSRYLCAIGLAIVFSLRWSLPPTSVCNPKQTDSKDCHHRRSSTRGYDNRPFTCYGQTTIKRSRVARPIGYKRQFPTPQLLAAVEDSRIRLWAFPISLAVTLGIIVIFFFSA
jgi:hypothetical protein